LHLFPPELEIGPDEGFNEKDIFGRREFGEVLTRIVRILEGPAVLLLDAPWGVGKTTFIKMWLGELSKIGIPNIYFDAFANDYHEDAFITVAGEIIARAETLKPRNSKTLKKFKDKAIGVAKILGRASVRFGVRAASAGLLTEEDGLKVADEIAKAAGDETAKGLDELLTGRLESHNADREAFDQFRTSLTELSETLAKPSAGGKSTSKQESAEQQRKFPLVFVIDELDRCRPPFALELLEKIKHFFQSPALFLFWSAVWIS
jgi:predicted KAP-like P-loop ATPase